MTQTVLLGDIGRIVTGKTPPKAHPEYWGQDFDFITPTDYTDSKFIIPSRKLSTAGRQAMYRIICPANSVIVTCIGSDMGKVALSRRPFVSNQQINTIIIDEHKSNPSFVYYLLKSNSMLLRKYAEHGGSTMPIINKSTFEKLKFDIPDIGEQKKIADILGTLDEKIELNRKMNEILEQIGQTLFCHYFIDNPEMSGWNMSTIGKNCDVILGGTPSRLRVDYWKDGTIGWINSGKVNEFRITEPSELITEEAVKKSAAKIMPKGTTVLAITGATLGQVSRLEKSFSANQSVIGIIGNDRVSNEFIYFWVDRNIEKIIGHKTGGAQQHINRANINEFNLILPPSEILMDFQNKIMPIMDLISKNCFENKNLVDIRDLILPRLIDGRLEIN